MLTKYNNYIKLIKEEKEYWGTEAAGVLPYSVETNKFLLNLRSSEVYEPNTWNLWGGKFDEGEEVDDVEYVCMREFKEETYYNGDIKLYSLYVYNDTNFKYHNFLGIMNEEFKPRLNWESSDYKWVTLEEMENIKPMHFGLKALLEHSIKEIKKLTNN